MKATFQESLNENEKIYILRKNKTPTLKRENMQQKILGAILVLLGIVFLILGIDEDCTSAFIVIMLGLFRLFGK